MGRKNNCIMELKEEKEFSKASFENGVAPSTLSLGRRRASPTSEARTGAGRCAILSVKHVYVL